MQNKRNPRLRFYVKKVHSERVCVCVCVCVMRWWQGLASAWHSANSASCPARPSSSPCWLDILPGSARPARTRATVIYPALQAERPFVISEERELLKWASMCNGNTLRNQYKHTRTDPVFTLHGLPSRSSCYIKPLKCLRTIQVIYWAKRVVVVEVGWGCYIFVLCLHHTTDSRCHHCAVFLNM